MHDGLRMDRSNPVMAVGVRETADLISERLILMYGELVSGQDLARELGMRSSEAMRSAIRRGRLPIRTFRMEGRRGWFALTADLANHLAQEINRVVAAQIRGNT